MNMVGRTSVGVLAVLGLTASLSSVVGAAPSPMSRDEIIALAQYGVGYSYWWGQGAWRTDGTQLGSCTGSCPSCTHTGSYGADCSGYAAKVWQVPSPSPVEDNGHPYSTDNFYSDGTYWSTIPRDSAERGDALVYRSGSSGHIFIYDNGDLWGSMNAYECKGCSYGCVHGSRTASSDYIAIRRDQIVSSAPTLEAGFVGAWSDAAQDPDGVVHFRVCTGQVFRFWFELRNTGTATWVDTNGAEVGQAVRLGVPTDVPDVFTGTTRVSVNENANSEVRPASANPPGGNCNDAPGCQNTVFSASGIQGTAPLQPGVYTTSWKLMDEGRGWFGPDLWLTYNVVDCDAPPPQDGGGSGGAPPAGSDASAGGDGSWPGEDAGTGVPGSGIETNEAIESDDTGKQGGCGCPAAAIGPRPHHTDSAIALLAFGVIGLLFRRRTRR